MDLFGRKRRRRLRDFAARIAGPPAGVRDLGEFGRYWPVHPTSDDEEFHARHGTDPAACLQVDLYWEYDCDVWFVKVMSVQGTEDREPGIYGWRAGSGYATIAIVVPQARVSTAEIAGALRRVVSMALDERRWTAEVERLAD